AAEAAHRGSASRGSFSRLVAAHRRGGPVSDIRQASLEHEPVRLPGGFGLQAGPFAILAIGALWLHRHFDELPSRLPVHWNWRGLVLAFAAILVMLVATFVALKGVPHGPVRNPPAWRGGLFYVDREDPALFVPKKYGAGYTFNYGRPLAWVITFAILIVPLAI